MIPLKLQLKNFLSYGSTVQTIDFAPYHLICLSGKNGHGKSALLDAITWAIWGQARKVSNAPKADAHLLRLGQTQMMVCLDFMCNGQTYRVRREYMQTYGKPITTLDFGILNEQQAIIPLTDKTIRATQHIIEQTLHLTFDAFVNSAFLRQGQANEFSKKSPKERKEIFAQILGLQEYEAVRKLATDKAKETINQKNSISLFQEKITTELQQSEQLDAQLLELETTLSNLAQQQALKEQERACCEHEKKILAQHHNEYEMLHYQIQELAKRKALQQKTLTSLTQEWQAIEKLHAQAPDPTLLEQQKQELTARIALHQKTLQQLLELKEQYLKQHSILQQLEQKLQLEQTTQIQHKNIAVERVQINLETTNLKLKDLLGQLAIKQQEFMQHEQNLAQLTTTIAAQTIDEQTFKGMEQKLVQGKEKYQQLIAQGNYTRQELINLEHKEKLSYDDENPCCPLCEQNLSVSRKRFLKTKLSEQRETLEQQVAQLTKDIQALKTNLLTEHTIFERQKTIREHNIALTTQCAELAKQSTTYLAQISTLEQQIQQTQTTQAQLTLDMLQAKNELITEQKKSQHALTNNPECVGLRKTCSDLEASLKGLNYNEKEHKAAANALRDLEQELLRWAQLQGQKALQGEREKQIAALHNELTTLQAQEQELAHKEKPYATLSEQETTLLKQTQSIHLALQAYAAQKEALLHKKGALENQKNKIIKLQQEYHEQTKQVCLLDTIANDYYEIAAATSQDGIQALLIENAIPEIEQEANRLLDKLTNNQAQIFIESLRDLKKGGTKETLDINISDGAGIRPYEMFSGGEAFRIDFALRIAISKLLAQRAGTSLQTLIIDEGFGSQDEEGLSLIMDALYKIQDDFSKVIIVSHLASMKDHFPIHFFVEKKAEGSRINIIETD
jgi:DNA repair protein SbcC/Rad50